ncbi:MAG: LuxR family transcriptional regulator [Gammaproteobacteria bacterium]|nr:LuxR family transcriptional regulator [Gammaproteobacteria bacterium]
MTSAHCHELIELLSKAGTVEEIHSACSALCEQFGFDRFQYGARIPTSFVKPYYIFISSYQNEWRDRYLAKGYMTIDPAVQYCANHLTPFSWDRIRQQEKNDKIVRQFMGEAGEFGLNSGVSIPVHSAQGEFAMFSAASSLDQERANSQIMEVLPFVHLFAAHLHETVRKILEKQVLPLSKVQLTDRERECLLWTAEGKTAWEISQILKISERTIVFHLQNAADKLNVVNRQQAVARAVSLGIISPSLV